MAQLRRIFVECTAVHAFGGNTGIQRETRNIIRHCEAVGHRMGIRCHPVIWDEASKTFLTLSHLGKLPSGDSSMDEWHTGLLTLARRIAHRMPFPIRQLLLQRHVKGCVKRTAARGKRWLWLRFSTQRCKPIRFGRRDAVFLLDASWHISPWQEVQRARQRGAVIGTMIHDLVPVTQSANCADELVTSFRAWLDEVLDHADFLVSISQTSLGELSEYLKRKCPRFAAGEIALGYYYLGTDLDMTSRPDVVREELRKAFNTSGQQRPYVCVSTIEPRKNHAYLLEAFDRAWAQGADASLVLVGKQGWKCDALLERIRCHPMQGKRLWLFHDLTDDELTYSYRHARAALSASKMEGFGLPVVEALSLGCEVWLSDIPVYREVARDFALYFDLSSPESLKELLLANDRTEGIHPARLPSEFNWPDWQTCTEHLLRRIVELSAQCRQRKRKRRLKGSAPSPRKEPPTAGGTCQTPVD